MLRKLLDKFGKYNFLHNNNYFFQFSKHYFRHRKFLCCCFVKPETATPCWRFGSYEHGIEWDVCMPVYALAFCFSIMGVGTAVMGTISLLRYRALTKFFDERCRGSTRSIGNLCEVLQRESVIPSTPASAMSSNPASRLSRMIESSAVVQTVQKHERYQTFRKVAMSFGFGGKNFWYRATLSFLVDIILQIIRAFVIDQSLAKISAGSTISQTILMMIHTWLFVYAYYTRSETLYFFSAFLLEIGYLIVRLSLQGPLSMAASSFVDFLTLAIPLFLTAKEVVEISDFILNYNTKHKYRSGKRSRFCKFCMVAVSFVTAVLGVTVIGLCIYKEFIQGRRKEIEFNEITARRWCWRV